MGAGNHPRTRKGQERGPRHGGKGHHGKHHDPHPGRAYHDGGTSTAQPPPNAPRLPGAHPPTQTAEASIRHRTDHTSAHPPATGNHTGMEGTPTRGEGATPTEEAAGNTAARRTTTPSLPGHDPSGHKGHLTGTRRGRRHGHSDQDWGPKPPEDTGPRHRPPGRATPRTVTRSTYPTHQPERHAKASRARTQRDTHT